MPFDAVPRKQNATANAMRKMASIFRRDGFSPYFRQGTCGCFCATAEKCAGESRVTDMIRFLRPFHNYVRSYSADQLIADGWTLDPTGEKAALLCERIASELEAA